MLTFDPNIVAMAAARPRVRHETHVDGRPAHADTEELIPRGLLYLVCVQRQLAWEYVPGATTELHGWVRVHRPQEPGVSRCGRRRRAPANPRGPRTQRELH